MVGRAILDSNAHLTCREWLCAVVCSDSGALCYVRPAVRPRPLAWVSTSWLRTYVGRQHVAELA